MTQNSISETNGAVAETTRTALNAKEFARACADIVTNHSGDDAHRLLDRLVTGHLTNLGFGEGMEIFMKHVGNQHGENAMKTIYLCGPINGCTDEECNDWREYVTENWTGDCINPMVRDYRGRETEAFREIVELDKIDVAQSDIILVNYDKPSVGTSMEVLYAWQLGKRIIVVCREDANISPWLRYHSTHIVHSFDDALATADAA